MAEVELQHVDKRYPNGTAALKDLSLTIGDGELMVFVGPSGCGKSTLLRVMAGLEEVTAGQIMIGGTVVNGLGAQQRNAAMVFQNYALYPHMTVRGNIEFPLRMMKVGKEERRRRMERTVALLGLGTLLDQRPKQLSGGQRQRVAMARALVRDPAVFLMDEPLSNLDAKLRVEIRGEIAALQRRTGTTTAYVTHDQIEAMTLGDRVAVLDAGVLQQSGTPQTLYETPANVFVAGFIGSPPMNLFDTVVHADGEGGLSVDFGARRLALPPDLVGRVQGLRAYLERTVTAGIRPEAISCGAEHGRGVVFDAAVHAVENLGHEQLIFFQFQGTKSIGAVRDGGGGYRAGAVLAARCAADYPAGAGDRIRLRVDPAKLHFFDREGNSLLTL